jgi:hypothetical protein
LKDNCKIKVGDEIELKLPNGKIINTRIAGINMVCRTPTPPPIPLLIPKEISKEDLIIGTEIWIDEEKMHL